VIKSGDTLDAVALAYREKNIKVTVAQILSANPGLKAGRLIVGKKIFIPAPQP
jgi:phage tail protein X